MRVSRIIIVAILVMAIVSVASAQSWNTFGGAQYTINLKSGLLPIGSGWGLMANLCHFEMTSFSQNYVYFGGNKGYFTPYVGVAGNWSGHDRLMIGSFVDVPYHGFTSNTELDLMVLGKKADIYWWQGFEYPFTIKGHSAAIGIQAETVRKAETNTQYGFHGSLSIFSAAFYAGPDGHNYRLGFTVPLGK
jgi:hypothetical protein